MDLDVEALSQVQENRKNSEISETGEIGETGETGEEKKQVPHFNEILANLQKIQLRNGLAPNTELTSLDFDIEMETGTGKTYVFLRSILELNKQYGFSKFIIVVPSIAIKEGVFHSLEITKEHFAHLFQGLPYEYFVYDSIKLDKVRSFVTNSILSIMVINIDAFKKDLEKADVQSGKKGNSVNVINKKHDKFDGMKPIDVIAETNPIVIIDEPQSVDTTDKSRKALEKLNPLSIFRYSATHVKKHTPLYRLDAVDSHELGLVKQIEVASFASFNNHNDAYLCLMAVNNDKNKITAQIEMDVQNKEGIAARKIVTVKQGSDLEELSGNRDIYHNYIVDEIYAAHGKQYVSFTPNGAVLELNKPVGVGVDDDTIKRLQIRKTIEEHLNKELRLNSQGIKVLSLFFIDRVANYRIYDNEGKPQLGKYGQWFEEEYTKLIRLPKYRDLKYYPVPAQKVHNGYFSQDKNKWKDTKGSTHADESTYDLIMKDKEKLLSFESDLRFIFSHSALREGWDNPNVFQICTLNETKSEVKKRQEIGRGLRLCVNQNGERLYDRNLNLLTVMANESYSVFADKLQKEYEEEQGIRFGMIEAHSFANLEYINAQGKKVSLGMEQSQAIYSHFIENKYIDDKGNITDTLRFAIKQKKISLPEKIEEKACPYIFARTKKLCSKIEIKNNADKKTVQLNKAVFCSPDFEELWNKIKWKTVYNIQFDSTELIKNCNKALAELSIKAPKLYYQKGNVELEKSGIKTEETKNTVIQNLDMHYRLPDILTWLQNKTGLTRQTLIQILVGNDSLQFFQKNPQQYMEEVLKIISKEKNKLIHDGIKYEKLRDSEFYSQELFENQELIAYFTDEQKKVKSVYTHIVFDSSVERTFANRLENNSNVKLYVKLPDWFKIPTPIGDYIPDWAILYEKDNEQRLYFVVETKSTLDEEQRRGEENYKIDCGKKHFKAITSSSDTSFNYFVADSYETFNKYVEE